MAFVVTALLAPGCLPSAPARHSRGARAARVSVRRTRWTSTATPGGPESGSDDYTPAGVELDTEALMARGRAIADDVGARPAYYGKLAGYGLAAIVALTILNAVVGAIDAIPVLPSALELVGLGYTSWFVWRYVIFKESREELMDEIEDLVGRARPPSSE